jgi:hypothetical protein
MDLAAANSGRSAMDRMPSAAAGFTVTVSRTNSSSMTRCSAEPSFATPQVEHHRGSVDAL